MISSRSVFLPGFLMRRAEARREVRAAAPPAEASSPGVGVGALVVGVIIFSSAGSSSSSSYSSSSHSSSPSASSSSYSPSSYSSYSSSSSHSSSSASSSSSSSSNSSSRSVLGRGLRRSEGPGPMWPRDRMLRPETIVVMAANFNSR